MLIFSLHCLLFGLGRAVARKFGITPAFQRGSKMFEDWYFLRGGRSVTVRHTGAILVPIIQLPSRFYLHEQ